MSRILARLAASLLLLVALAPAVAHAQLSNGNVVSACGTPNTSYGVNNTRAITQDTTGLLCTGATFTGSITVTNAFALEATQLANKADLDALVAAAANPAAIMGTNGTTIATPANPLDVQAVGRAASGASVAGNPLLDGCRAALGTGPTAVTDGQAIARQCDALGANVTRPYAVKELQVKGSTGAQTGTGAQTFTGIGSAGGSLKNYIVAVQCTNSGVNTSIVTLNDSATTVLSNPAGAGSSYTFPVPLATAAATALTANFGTASTSQYCSAQGYTGL